MSWAQTCHQTQPTCCHTLPLHSYIVVVLCLLLSCAQELGPNVPSDTAHLLSDAAFAIWTTTPWTIPANLAVAVNGTLEYAIVEASPGDGDTSSSPGDGAGAWSHKRLVVAEALVEELEAKLGVPLRKLGSFSGANLEGCSYQHPLAGRISQCVVGGDYITTDSGTGLVHTAPGHGQEDYIVGQRFGLPLLSPVDDEGRFTAEAGGSGAMDLQRACVFIGNVECVLGCRCCYLWMMRGASLLKQVGCEPWTFNLYDVGRCMWLVLWTANATAVTWG